MSRLKPIRVFYSEMSGNFYATRHYRDRGNGHVDVTGEKFDVTQDIARAITHYGVEFHRVQPTEWVETLDDEKGGGK